MMEVVIISNDTKKVFQGFYIIFYNMLIETRYAEIESIQIEDCILKMKTKKIPGDNFKMLPQQNSIKIHSRNKHNTG